MDAHRMEARLVGGWMLLWSLHGRAFIHLVLWRPGEGPMGIGLWAESNSPY